MLRLAVRALGLALALVSPCLAQPVDCSDGVSFDDGSFENALGSSSVFTTHLAMRIDPDVSPARLDSVCVCFARLGSETDLEFDMVVWDSNGTDGAPDGFLGGLAGFVADNVPFGLGGQFYRVDLSSLAIVTERPVYIGPSWDSGTFEDFFVCSDESAGTPRQPGYFDAGIFAGLLPPVAELGDDLSPTYRALGIRAVFEQSNLLPLRIRDAFAIPGFEIATTGGGPTVFVGVRTTLESGLFLSVDSYGETVGAEPRRSDEIPLSALTTWSRNIADDLVGLDPDDDGIATGLVLIREMGAGTESLSADYLRVDLGNNLATGDRALRTEEDLCDVYEVRFLDFGNGTELRILANLPRGEETPTLTYQAYSQDGEVLDTGEYFTDQHLNVLPIEDLVSGGQRFGSVRFDFTNAGGGWVGARYSAFGRFSVELNGECRDGLEARSLRLTRRRDTERGVPESPVSMVKLLTELAE